jgi:hypothetical protein
MLVLASAASVLLLFIGGVVFFQKMENKVADAL